MNELLDDLLLFESSLNIFTILFKIILAVLFGGIIGNERGKHGSQAGLRTHILVCLGSTMTSLAGVFSNEILGYNGDPFRISAQVVSGIGFLGAGMIIVRTANIITGLTTAAGMWTTATIGIALGMGFYSGAFVVMLACVFTTAFLTKIERNRKNTLHIYIEVDKISLSGDITDEIRNMLNNECLIELMPPKSGTNGYIGVTVMSSSIKDSVGFRNELNKIDGVAFSVIE